MRIIITIVAVLSVVASGQEEMCTRGAEFIVSLDVVTSTDILQNVPDPDLTFFREVLQFTEQEIETAAESAIEFFNTTFGLDFSESVPNEQGRRFFQNASFYAANLPFTATAKANRWLVNGNTKSRCFDARLGWFGVRFLDNQVLYGTYGGTEGRTVPPSNVHIIKWMYAWINTCPQSPLVIQMWSTAPGTTTPDGVVHEIFALSHRGVGDGVGVETLYIIPLPPDRRFARIALHTSMTFPADQIP